MDKGEIYKVGEWSHDDPFLILNPAGSEKQINIPNNLPAGFPWREKI